MFYGTSVFDDMFNGFDRVFRGAGIPIGQVTRRAAPTVGYPAVEAFRRDEGLVLRAELPGVAAEDLDIQVENDRLVLRGEKKARNEQEDGELFFRETSYGKFERSFRLPEGTTGEGIEASFENGVLEVRIPVKPESRSRRIPIAGLAA